MDGSKVAVERLLIDPYFLDVDEAGLEYVFGVTILQAAFFVATGISHPLHDRSSCLQIWGRQAKGSYDQQHDVSV